MPDRIVRKPASALATACAAFLGGCVHYTPAQLATEPPLATAIGDLVGAGGPLDHLSIEQVVKLALVNNPDLKAIRLKRAIATGQTGLAGILPNPSLSGAFLPLLSGAGTVPAWNIGLS